MIDFKSWTLATWLNVAMIVLASLAGAGWWTDFISDTKIVTAVSGGLLWVSSVLNLLLNGTAKAPVVVAPVEPAVTPPAA